MTCSHAPYRAHHIVCTISHIILRFLLENALDNFNRCRKIWNKTKLTRTAARTYHKFGIYSSSIFTVLLSMMTTS